MGILSVLPPKQCRGKIKGFLLFRIQQEFLLQHLQEMIHMYFNNQELQCCPYFYQLLLFDKIVADLETLVMSATNKVTNTKLALSLEF